VADLWNCVTVASGPALANVAQVGAKFTPVDVDRVASCGVMEQGKVLRVDRWLHVATRTPVQRVSF